MQWAITQALRNAAVALQEEIAAHKGSAKTTISKQYERDSERAIEVLKRVQLFRLNCNKNLMATRLATCPLQLGYADMDQWNRSRDCCGRPTGITGLADVLKQRCRCGLISLKRRLVAQAVVTPAVPEAEWVGVLTHQLKEQAVQRFFKGSVYMQACGLLKVDGDKAQHSMVFLDQYSGRQSRPVSVRHHLCFVCSEDMESGRVLQCLHADGVFGSQRPSSAGSNLEERVMNRNEMFSHSEFHLCLRWEGVGRQVLCLEKPSSFKDMRVRVFVGEYVGPEHYAIAALQDGSADPRR